MGFAFDRGGELHYGVASISLGPTESNDGLFFTINSWAWQDEADTPISTDDAIPEPSAWAPSPSVRPGSCAGAGKSAPSGSFRDPNSRRVTPLLCLR